MQDEFDKILNNSIEYLKFFNEHYNLPLDFNKINVNKPSDADLQKSLKENKILDIPDIKITATKENLYRKNTEKNEITPKVEDKSDIVYVKDDQYELLGEDWKNAGSLNELKSMICSCEKCKIGKTRNKFVFGEGNPSADVVLIGEAPGYEEDMQGEPFVGRAGRLLNDILKAINFKREEVYICNILKCRPPDNRNPLPDEVKNCEPYLLKQLSIIKPGFILALGSSAAQTLLRKNEPLGKMRGKFYDFVLGGNSIKFMVTYHPAALLRNPNWKRPAWEDVQIFRKEYDNAKTKKRQ